MKSFVVPGMSRAQIENEANALLKRLQPDAYSGDTLVDVETVYDVYIVTEHGIKTGYRDLSKYASNILGFTNAKDKVSFVDKSLIDSDDPVIRRRCRATIGHEIGHCLYHVPILQDYISFSLRDNPNGFCRKEKSLIKAYEDPEWQAWEFAGAFLMPKTLIMECIQDSLSRNDIAEKFDVNPSFVDVRLKYQLKINPSDVGASKGINLSPEISTWTRDRGDD